MNKCLSVNTPIVLKVAEIDGVPKKVTQVFIGKRTLSL